MAKVTYASLKLKIDTSVESFDFNGATIEVLKYLPIQDKYELVMMALDKAKDEHGLYNPILLDMYFHLYLVYMYANITFTDKQKEDELKLYDTLQSNGLLSKILVAIPEAEYNHLQEQINDIVKYESKYKTTAGYFINSLFNDIPEKIESIQAMVDDIDKEKFQNVIDFAKAANGNRDI